jgi:hypothetical protein
MWAEPFGAQASFDRPRAHECSACSGIGENCEVASTCQLHKTMTLRRRLHHRPCRRIEGDACISHSVGERQQIVGARLRLLLDRQSDHFPASRR